MVAAVLDIFSRGGYAFISRYLHVVVGITWIGLLYFFNFVQVPAFAEMEAAARNNAIDKLASRALWWFRWAAVATVVTGLLILGFQRTADGSSQLTDMDYFKSLPGHQHRDRHPARAHDVPERVGDHLAEPADRHRQRPQRAGRRRGRPDAAAGAGRKALLASRQNTIFSLPMLVFMVGTAHFPYDQILAARGQQARRSTGSITLVIWAVARAERARQDRRHEARRHERRSTRRTRTR